MHGDFLFAPLTGSWLERNYSGRFLRHYHSATGSPTLHSLGIPNKSGKGTVSSDRRLASRQIVYHVPGGESLPLVSVSEPDHEAGIEYGPYFHSSHAKTYVCRNRFLLLEKLGKGGFGLIYSGVDLQTGRSVAIKLVRPFYIDLMSLNSQEDSKLTKKRYLRLEYHIYRRYHSSWFYLPYNEERNSKLLFRILIASR